MPIPEELAKFVKDGLGQGVPRGQLTALLLEHGWAPADIDMAFAFAVNPHPEAKPVQPAPKVEAPVIAPITHPAPVVEPVHSAPVVAQTPVSHPAPVVSPAPVAVVAPAIAPKTVVNPMAETTSFIAPTTMAQPQPEPKMPKVKKPNPFSGIPVAATVGGVIALLVIGGVTYAAVNKIGPFASQPYTEENILSGLLERAGTITSSTYSLSGELFVEPRDEGAEPFTLQVSNEGETRQKYQNDAERAKAVSRLLSYLRSKYDTPYPKTIDALAAAARAQGASYLGAFSVNDPVTKAPFEYRITEGGENFAIVVTFETSNAVSKLRKTFDYTEEATKIEGNTITFTKNSSPYFYLSSEPAKPFLVALGESLRMLPAEVRAKFGVTAGSEWDAEESSWKFNLDFEGDFGDLTYKVNGDVLKKEDIYYFRINNIPSLFMSSLPIEKGEWVKVDPAASSTDTGYRSLSSYTSQLTSAEENYKEYREEWVMFMKKVVTFADEEKLVRFKSEPKSEKIDGRQLYRYELETNKEAILPFYEKVVAEAGNGSYTLYEKMFNDPGVLEYLKSEEFSQVFDYMNENITYTLWVDAKGYPARVEYSMRIVPPDTATQLEDKQVRITWVVALSDINKPVEIEVPEDARPLEEILEETNANRDNVSGLSSSVARSNLMSLAVQAELHYDSNNNSYSTRQFPLGACASVAGTLFGNTKVYESLLAATRNSAGSATCSATANTYAVSVPLPDLDGYSWCVDSTGVSKQIVGELGGTACQ